MDDLPLSFLTLLLPPFSLSPSPSPSSSLLLLLVSLSLTKDVENRPRFHDLLEHPFIKKMEKEKREVETWYREISDKEKEAAKQ